MEFMADSLSGPCRGSRSCGVRKPGRYGNRELSLIHISTLRSAAVLQLVGSLKYFDLFYVMMGGAPNKATELMATYMYKKGFTEFRMGYASTIAASMFILCFAIACIFLYITRNKEAA